MKSPPFKAPGPPFDASAAAGKTVYAVPASSSIPVVIAIEEATKEAAESQGVNYVEVKNQGQPSEWNAGLQQAINAHADAIILDEIDPALVKNEMAKAEAAGIPVISSHEWITGEKGPSNVAAIVPVPFLDLARLLSDWAIWKTDGKGQVVIIGETLSPPSAPIVEEMKAQFAKYGPEMTVEFTEVPFTEWSTKLQPATQTALNQYPETDYVLPIYDSMLEFVNPAIQASGKADSVKVAGGSGTPFVLEELEEGNPPFVEMTVAEDNTRSGWAVMDQVLRVLTGTPTTEGSAMAYQVVTKENAAERFEGVDFKEDFSKLWSDE
jgi:ribose transport system substrate-binding protein